MFFIIWFLLSWSIWLIFADKKRWREIIPVCIFADFLGSLADIIVEYYKYWEYLGNVFHPLILDISDELGIYPVVTYLFIQWFPKTQSFWRIFFYWFAWTGLAIIIEYIHLITGHMEHSSGWTLWHSYVADWILFFLFYQFHKMFDLRKLSTTDSN